MKGKGILKTILDEVLLILLFMGVGSVICSKLNLIRADSALFFVLAFSYFLGMLFDMILVRFMDLILKNLKITFWIVVIFDVYAGIFAGGFQNILQIMRQFDWKIWTGIVCACFFLAIVIGIENNSFFSTKDDKFLEEGKISVYSSLGTLHTVRSVNIALTAVNENRIPLIGINYGPTLILTFFQFLKNSYLYFANYIFTVGNSVIMFLFFIGMLQEFFAFSFGFSIFATFIICWGGEGIGLRYKLSTDGASCTYWGLSSTYPDVLAAFACFLVWIYQLFLLLQDSVSLVCIAIYSVVCVLIWCIISPQFYILAVGILASNTALFLFGNSFQTFSHKLIILFLFSLISGIFAICFGGGMLNHSAKIRKDIAGAESGSGLTLGNWGIILADLLLLKRNTGEYDIISRNIKEIMQALFYPLLSIGLLLNIWPQSSMKDETVFWGIEMLFLLLGGLIIEIGFSDRQSTGKRELTRFLAPALVISRILYMLILGNHMLHAGGDYLSIVGIIAAVSMVIFEVPYHIIFIQKYCNIKIYELFSVWFYKADIVCDLGRYAGESELNRYRLQKLRVKSDEIHDKKIYIYGTGKIACQKLDKFRESDMQVAGFIDSNPKKWKQKLQGLPIYSPYTVSKMQDENTVVVIGSNITGTINNIFYVCQLYRIRNTVCCEWE